MANRQIANRLIRQVSEMSVRFSPIIPMNLTVTENNNCCHSGDSVHGHRSLTRTRSCDCACECKVRAKLSFSCHMAVIVYIFCAVGCLYQVYEVSDMYFKYKTVTNLRIFRPKNIVPPAVSICFPYLQLINFTLAFEKYPEMESYAYTVAADLNETIDFNQKQMLVFKNSEGDFDQIFSRFLQENYTVGEILSVTKDIQDILMRCVITDPEDYTVIQSSSFAECSKVWNIDDYVKDESKCFRFRFKRTTNRTQPEIYKLEQLSSKFAWRSLLMQVRLNIETLGKKMERMFLYLHSHDKYPTGRTDSVLEFRTPTDVDSTYTITYSRVWNRLLDHPYDSNCKYYPVNRGHEVDQCIIESSMANYGRVPFTLLFQSDSDLKVFGFLAIMGNKTLENELRDLIHECMFKFEHLDCELEVFKAEMLHKHIGGNNLKIEVSIPSAQDIENELHKKQDVLEYFIYNGSVLGFWFGFCVSKLVKIFVLVEKLFSKKPRPRRATIETTQQNSFD